MTSFDFSPPGPKVFKVGATFGAVSGGGMLKISVGEVVLEPGTVTRRIVVDASPVIHRERHVLMLKSRLLPPHMNTRLVLKDWPRVGIAAFGGFARKEIRSALRAADFIIDERAVWISFGTEYVQPWP